MKTRTNTKPATKRRHIDWFNVIWALSQIVMIAISIDLIAEVCHMAYDWDYCPTTKGILLDSLGMIGWMLVNPCDPISYLRGWIWDHRYGDDID